uniref:Putative cytochrome oxidase complex assembly protein 1 n=1 Tax=Amblyomma cajennense TaxID=34607 RepID=A0A023FN96_AMBCJ
MPRLPSLDRLVQAAGFAGIGIVCSSFWFKHYLGNKMTDLDYYKNAMTTLRGNSAAMKLLGEPIKELRIDIGDSASTSTRPHRARMKVPIKGSKQRGELYLWAERHALDVPWELLRLELGLEQHKDKRLLVYANPKYASDYVQNFDIDVLPAVSSSATEK